MMSRISRYIFWLFPVGYSEAVWLLSKQPVSFYQVVAVVLVSLGILSLPEIVEGILFSPRRNWPHISFFVCAFLAGIFFFSFFQGGINLPDFLLFCLLTAVLLLVSDLIGCGANPWLRGGIAVGFALLFGLAVIGYLQVVERFSDEEFFAALQAFLLSIWFFLVWLAWQKQPFTRMLLTRYASRSVRWALFIAILALVIPGGYFLLRSYQSSFFPEQAQVYPSITESQPFLCGTLPGQSESAADNSQQVFKDIVGQTAANPTLRTPDFGMLALTSSDPAWKASFKQAILAEARRGEYTGPSNSVKFGQYETALRAYFYKEITQRNPALFSASEKQEILNWFAAVNRRSLTVEWVDWMYAAALGEWPKGPYLNQENGSSLLALLEAYNYADPALRQQNQDFLRAHPFGWQSLFHNTDDSIFYQALWINNALFESLWNGQPPEEHIVNSFKWLLLQALPDGGLVGYNPDRTSLAAIAYLGAQMTGDERLMWLASRSVDYLKSHNLVLRGQPGLLEPVSMKSASPDVGSCLIFSNSGTPVRKGPLTPDKIVFRNGWQTSDFYLSLNLRFTGWHRYKAPNAVISVYKEEPLIVEQTISPPVTWLPVGRSLFRDKRIARENLNGFLIQRTGVSQFVYWLTGFGSSWAQDPPFYAPVQHFSTGQEMDSSETILNWNGWKQTRKVFLVHDGPVVVLDQATGPANRSTGIIWHGITQQSDLTSVKDRVLLGQSGKTEMRLIALDGGTLRFTPEKLGSTTGVQALYTNNQKEHLQLATLFLSDTWRDATVQVEQDFLVIRIPGREVKIPLKPAS